MVTRMLAVAIVACAPTFGAAEGDATNGEKVFRKCKACHAVGEDAENKAGPVLNGVVDRQVGAVSDFKYSKALMALAEEGTVWSSEELSAFLEKPKAYAKGTKMAFPGLRKESDRLDLIAYLATFAGNES